jgi:hypothetical protein
MMPLNARFGTITLRPSFLQWVTDKCGWITINIIGYCLYFDSTLPTAGLILMIAMSLHILYMLLYLRLMKFTVTDEQIIYNHGVFNRKSEFIELYRVIDFHEDVSFIQNLLDIKTVTVHSGDRTTPRLRIPGIPLGYPLVQTLRERVEYNKRRKGIYEITNR